jgi:1-acyl-sn-glycerol-3-phosphate acyltransferase
MAFDPDRLDRRDPRVIRGLLPIFRAYSERYVRLRATGLEHLDAKGPVLFVANHSGGISGPDLPCTLATLWSRLGPDAPLYALAHDFAMRQLRPLGVALQKLGAIRASRANALRVFEAGGHVLVYPGGDLDAYRSFRERDRIVFGDRTGFIRIARDAGVPIVPIVVQGAHRSALVLSDGEWLARRMKLQRRVRVARFPVALAAPWGVSLGPWLPWMPLPFDLRMRVLDPIHVPRDLPPADGRELVRTRMQAALDELARAPS